MTGDAPRRGRADRDPRTGTASVPLEAAREAAAWEEIEDGRWLPYRIRGSWRGVLG